MLFVLAGRRPVAFRSAGPLAHTQATPTPGSRDSNAMTTTSNSGFASYSGAAGDPPTRPYSHASTSAAAQPSKHPLDYGLAQQHQQQQPPLPPSSAQSNVFSDNLAPSVAQLARPLQPQAAAALPSSDPLSHLLRDGMHMNRDVPPEWEDSQGSVTSPASAAFDYKSFPSAQTQPPPVTVEPTGWGASAASAVGGLGHDRDNVRERVR